MKTKHSYHTHYIHYIGVSILISFLILTINTTKGQAYKNNWYFGANIGLNFNSGNPVFVAGSQIPIASFNHSTTMSDDNGNLLFYSDAQTIWNANNTIVTGLVGGFLKGSKNTSQGVSFKNPANPTQYYYFYLTNTFDEGKAEFENSFYYSIIETNNTPTLTLNVEDVEVFCTSCTSQPFSEGLTAIPHCNGIDYWVIVHGDKELVVYLVNATGVHESAVFNFNLPRERGNLKASPDGTKLAIGIAHLTGGVRLYDFNSTTGQISNEIIISNGTWIEGISFSPNSQVLYTSKSIIPTQTIEYFDLTTPFPYSSNSINNTSSFNMQLANDGRIYINRGGGVPGISNFMGVINNPDNFANPNYIAAGLNIDPGAQVQAISQFIDAIQPPIPTDFIVNIGSCGLVDVAPNPCWTGYNFSWNFGDGIGTSNLTNTNYQYTSAGTFNITLTVSLGSVSQNFTQQVTVNTCCTSPLGSSTVPVTGANSSSYPFGLLGTTIAINGNFTINTNFTITNKTLLMAPNIKIIVLPGAKLTINKSKLYSCGTDMWDGIEIRPGGELIISNKTFIEDAKIAVLSDNFGGIAKFDISNTLFNRNHTGIKVQKYQTGTPHPGLITGCTFDSRPSVTSTTNTRLLDAPFQNQTAETGVELSSINSFLVGNTSTPATKNYFKYLLKGIYGLNAVYTVYNNEFSDNAPKGWAIYNLKSSKTFVGGSGTNQPNTFKNLYNGISHRSSSDLLVENNTFTNINLPNILLGSNAVSVYTFECNSATITLQRNQLSNVTNGFVHFKNADARYTVKDNSFNIFTGKAVAGIENNRGNIDVVNNTMNNNQNFIYSGNTGVYVAGTGNTFATSTVVHITNNTIGKINKGIHVIGTGRPIIEKNTITFNANVFPSLSEFYFGIRTQNCAREEIHLNTVDKVGATPVESYTNALYGISVESSTLIPFISENTVKKMGSGFRFRNFVGDASFSCNTMNKSWYGLTIDNAKIGNQGEAPSGIWPNGLTGDNFWTNPNDIGSSVAVKGLGTIYSPAFYTKSVGYPFTPPDVLPLSTISTFYSTPSVPLNPLAPELCQTICYDPSTCKIPRLAKIARNENPFDQVLGNERFMMQEAVLRGVISDSLVMDTTMQDGRDLQTYIDTLALTNVGKLVEVNTLLSRGDTLLAEALNLSINPKECADAYHKIVNEIYFRTWAKDVFEFTPTDSTILYDIAVQDPLICGTAIYNARVMMNIDVNDYSVDDNGKRFMNKKDAVEKEQQLPKGKLYPNPSQHTVNYEINLAAEQAGLLVFYDTMGKEVMASQLTTDNNKLTLDVSKFKNGLYLYKVFVNGKPQEMGKFIIQH